jgi:succinate dehydrogenase/fumarate reductase cytochrome b subunit
VTTIIERTPATRATLVKTILVYLVFTTAWVYGFANGQHDLPGIVVLAFFLLPLGVHFLLGFALAKQEACALLAYGPVLALVGPGLSFSLFVPLAMLAVFPGAPLVLLGGFVRLRMEPREVEDTWF